MLRKTVSAIMLLLLVASMLTLAFEVQVVRADGGTIYINADGSINPSTAPIYTADNITYTLTSNIINADGIVVERNNIVLDGAGYILQGPETHFGITVSGRSNVIIENMTIDNFLYGISISSVSNSTISGNKITNNGYGIVLYSSSNYTSISENYIAANNFDGIDLFDTSNYNSVSGNNITANYNNGISLYSSNNTITENNITANSWFGISIDFYSNYNNISGNNLTNNGDGISLSHSSNDNVISENNITNNFQGIWVDSSSNNTVSGNNIIGENTTSYEELGIILVSSNYTSISRNTFTSGSLLVWDSYQSSVENNTVNGKPLVYLENSSNRTVDDAGQVVLVNCENITVEALNLSRTDCGIELWETNKSTISGNNITTSNEYGIYLESSLNNCISGNNITNNVNGVYLYSCSNNSISGNNITNNVQGVWVGSSSTNSIFHNNFINNSIQVYSANSVNTWDNGYLSGGNYWSNYNGTDSNHDGTGDTPYFINANNLDNYPLMSPWHLVGDLNGDGKVGLDDLVLLANAYGSKVGDSNWNPLADIAPPYGIISLTDLVTMAFHYGQHSP